MEKRPLCPGIERITSLRETLTACCAQCNGLCCVCLYFFKSEGFPENKTPGTPCGHLKADDRCAIHPVLAARGLYGCLAFDCLGAGQKTTTLYGAKNWRNSPKDRGAMFETFYQVRSLHQKLWYLMEAATLAPTPPLKAEAENLIGEIEAATGNLTRLNAGDGAAAERRANDLFEAIWARLWGATKKNRKTDFCGVDFKGAALHNRDFAMALLLGANLAKCDLSGARLLGADLRGAHIEGTDLTRSHFLTQAQLNAAVGDADTKLPPWLTHPFWWREARLR